MNSGKDIPLESGSRRTFLRKAAFDTERLIKTLRQQNVHLPQQKLSPVMTR